jgi:hypothetical protein
VIKLERAKLDASRTGSPSVIQVEQGADGQLKGVLPGNRQLQLPGMPRGLPMLRPQPPAENPRGAQ